jgi:hypothetical protein
MGLGISFDWMDEPGRALLRAQLAMMPSMSPKRRPLS